jgi:hypothetical protein
MVKSTPLPNGSVIIKTRRMGARVGLLMFLLVGMIGLGLIIAGTGIFAPNSLALVQQQSLALLRGGIVAEQEQTFVDGCVRLEGFDTPQAITRTRRVVVYADGTTLEVVFSGRPTPTNMTCP